MPSPTWHLDGATARLKLHELTATIDAARPERGLSSLAMRGVAGDAHVLGISGSVLESPASTLVEWYVRGSDLIAAYEVAGPEAARVDLSWRAAASTACAPWFACIDLLVSVRTDQLDWRHDVYIEGYAPAALHALAVEGRTEACEALLHQGGDWSYAEFIRPADLRGDGTSADADGGNHLRRHLFPSASLEKGVILRARVRGLFFPAATPRATVVRCYEEFIAAEPPLGG